MILYRCFAWNERSRRDDSDGPLWFPRAFQGEGRHDNPDLYGCLYLADRPLSCIVEQLARFRTQRLSDALLRRRGLPLALAELELDGTADLFDCDNPKRLTREKLRPSLIATRERQVTQPQARSLFERYERLAGLRWWSTYESMWANVTVFERAAGQLSVNSVERLSVSDHRVIEAVQFFGMLPMREGRSSP